MALSFACRDAGATCPWSASASSEDELVRKVADHVQRKHRVHKVSRTIANFAVAVARRR